MLSQQQLITFHTLYNNNQIESLDKVLWANTEVDYGNGPSIDEAEDLGIFWDIPDIKFTSTCNIFNILYDMKMKDIPVSALEDENIKSYLVNNVLVEDNAILLFIRDTLQTEWSLSEIENVEAKELAERVNTCKLSDVNIQIVEMTVIIQGYVEV